MHSLQMLPWPVTGQYVSRRSSTVQLYVPFLYLKLQVAFEMHSSPNYNLLCFRQGNRGAPGSNGTPGLPGAVVCMWWTQQKTGAREGDTRGERERLHGRPPKIVSHPSPITWQPLRELSKVLTENDWPCTNKACRQKTYRFAYLVIHTWKR